MKRPAGYFDTPALRYLGSKWKMADWIVSHFPDHVTYIEPFFGSGAVFLRKPESQIEILNDLDGRVVNFFSQLRDNTDELVRAISLTPYAMDEYMMAHEMTGEPLEDARRFYVIMWQSYGSVPGSGWRRKYRLSAGRRLSITAEWSRLDGLEFAARALKNALIDNCTALETIARYDEDSTLFYVDPPYVHSSRKNPSRAKYALEMTEDDHRNLLHHLNHVRGMVVLSGYANPIYAEMLTEWQMFTAEARTNGNGIAQECLWLNQNALQAKRQMRLL